MTLDQDCLNKTMDVTSEPHCKWTLTFRARCMSSFRAHPTSHDSCGAVEDASLVLLFIMQNDKTYQQNGYALQKWREFTSYLGVPSKFYATHELKGTVIALHP